MNLIVVILIFFVKSIVADSSCADWLPYKDEKCYKIIDETLRTFADAEKTCANLEGSPSLPIIRSNEEQDFLYNYLFKTQKKPDNFWIGAKFLNNSFKWIDNTDLSYTNLDPKGTKNKPNFCVQIQADELLAGKWNDEPCEKKNAVVCQKMQTWSLVRLQEEFLNERKHHRDALDLKEKTLNQKLENVSKDLLVTKNQLTSIIAKLTETMTKLENSEKNPIPIGFIYVQLSNQPEPKTLWSTVQWKDVISEYAGLFFRAEGGGAAQFGTVQEENAPRVTEVAGTWHPNAEGDANHWEHTILSVGDWSTGLGIFAGAYGKEEYGTFAHRFHTSGGEVRPRNHAMRIWKRII